MSATIDSALTTLNRAKAIMEISGTSKNAILTQLIIAVSDYIQKTYCHREFKRQSWSNQVYDGSGTEVIYLNNSPIIEGQAFTAQKRQNVQNEDDWEIIDSEDLHIYYDSGKVVNLNGWSEGFRNYRFSYTAGFYLPSDALFQDGTNDELDLPADLELAAIDLVAAMYNRRKSAGVQSQKVFNVAIVYGKLLEDNPAVKETLDRYKRMSY